MVKQMTNEQIKDKFVEKTMSNGEHSLKYRFFIPKTKEGEQYPLVVYLHGMGERGDDSILVLKYNGAVDFAAPEWQEEHPCYVFAPQCPENMDWTSEENVKLLYKAIKELPEKYPIDNNRVYLTGFSMGGTGTWNLIARYPDLFAAAMPVCGAGIAKNMDTAKSVPVWAFHAEDDPVVPVSASDEPEWKGLSGSRRLVIRLRGIGNRHVHYTEYPAGFMEEHWNVTPHASWVAAYSDKKALAWMFEQNRKQRYDIEFIMPGIWQIGDCWYGTHIHIVEGADKALVIDTGMIEDTVGVVKSLTRLPYELICTHVHYDHVNNADQFGKFYMSKKELPVWDFYKTLIPENTSTVDDIIDIKHGDKLDLGGGVVIEAFEVAGHSPGSLMLIDRYHHVCFAGDTIGNGQYTWIQVPGSLKLLAFKANIDRFLDFMEKENLNDITFLGGHRRQEWWEDPDRNYYNPLCRELFEDMSKLCTMIVNDEVKIEESNIVFDNKLAKTAKYGMAIILFDDANKG